MDILLFSGSLRIGSLNKKLLAIANGIVSQMPQIKTQTADLKSLSIPVYDGDIEATGIPDGVKKLGQMIQHADALIIASPEYNGSIASPLKNTIDWVSRLTPMPWDKKPILLIGASPGGLGAIRALRHERVPFDTLGSFVYPQTFGLAKAHEAFTPTDELKDEATQKKVSELITNYILYAQKLTGKNTEKKD